jgi:Sulfotransferase family
MLISNSRKFIFIHIQKTGGSSIEQVIKENVPDAHPILARHDHASWAKSEIGAEWEQYFKFSFVRNPWDRLVSWYTMITQRALTRTTYSRLWDYTLETSTNFEEFIYNCTDVIEEVGGGGKKSFMYNQKDYLVGEDGQSIVDFIGRFETFNQDAEAVLTRLGLPGVSLPHVNKSSHRHYSEYYSAKTKNIIAERYARDISFFSYKFEPCA